MALMLTAPVAVGWSLLASLTVSLAGVSLLVAGAHWLPIQYLGGTLAWSAAYLESVGLAEGIDLAGVKDGASSLGKAQAQVRIAIHAFVLIFVWNVLGGGILLACQLASQLSHQLHFSQLSQLPLGVSSAARPLRSWVQIRLVPVRLASYLSGLSLLAGALDYCLRAAREQPREAEAGARPLRRALSWTDAVRHRLSLSFALSGAGGPAAHALDVAGLEEEDAMEEFVSEADLRDFERRVNAVGGEGEEAGVGTPGAAWTHLSRKESAHLTSHQWICSNAEDRLCGFQSGGLQMLVKTVFEGVSFEDVRAFWIDDDFRGNWDRCFMSAEKVLECSCAQRKAQGEAQGGSSGGGHGMCERCGHVVRWVRKFPAFCSPREYIIARRSFFDAETKSAYVVSKSVDFDLPPKIKRVKEYYSAWRIRAVPSKQRPGEMAVETMLLHYEDLGVPNSIFKLAMRTFFGWFITGLESNGLREYVKQRHGQGKSKGKGKGARACPAGAAAQKGGLALAPRGRESPRWKALALCAAALLVGAHQKRHSRRRW